jgi:hypothetical protein
VEEVKEKKKDLRRKIIWTPAYQCLTITVEDVNQDLGKALMRAREASTIEGSADRGRTHRNTARAKMTYEDRASEASAGEGGSSSVRSCAQRTHAKDVHQDGAGGESVFGHEKRPQRKAAKEGEAKRKEAQAKETKGKGGQAKRAKGKEGENKLVGRVPISRAS